MALWKPFRGTSAALAEVPKTDGHAYFCTDDGSLFFDYKDENNELRRKQITAKVDDALSSASTNPVQNKAINTALANKVDKVSGKDLSTNDLTAALKLSYDTAYTHSQATHARTDATKVEASTTNGKIKIDGTETTVYTHPTGTNPHGTTKSDIGLENVGNFKAVSTVASQGLTDAEKSNARANIGAGTSSFTGYTSSNKLAASNVSGLATIATSGSYNDLRDKPAINEPAAGKHSHTVTSSIAADKIVTAVSSNTTKLSVSTGNDTFVKSYPGTTGKLNTTSIIGVSGSTSASAVSGGTTKDIAKAGTAVVYGKANVGTAVTVATRAASQTTVGNANVGTAVNVVTGLGGTAYSAEYDPTNECLTLSALTVATTNINPAASSSTKIYGCGGTTSINPAVNAPDTQTIIPAVSNGQITGSYTIGNVTVPVAAATATTVATGTVASTGSGASILTGLGTAVTASALTSANLASGETGTSVVTSITPIKGAVSGISGTAAENGEHTHGTVIVD